MIRPFTFDEKKLLWDGLYNNGYGRGVKNESTNNWGVKETRSRSHWKA